MSISVRLFLVILLPCIAIAFYIEGQSYDPALIAFKDKAPSIPSEAASSTEQVPSILEYKLISSPRVFTSANLYEHVNGHAEYFISMGFVKLTLYEYGKSGTIPEIQVEVYDMGKALQAFGVLMDTKPQNPINIGTMGFKTQDTVSFISGRLYVRVIAYQKSAQIMDFAKSFASKLPVSKDNTFDILSRLPKLGSIISTRYIKEGYRGMDFLSQVLEREYNVDGKTVFLALIVSDKPKQDATVKSAMNFAKENLTEFQETEISGVKILKFLDKYEGSWVLLQGKDFLMAMFGEIEDELIHKVANVR